MSKIKKRKNYPFLRTLQPLEMKILKFLWRWKVATTLTLKNLTYECLSDRTFYNKLKQLRIEGYIRQRATFGSRGFIVWELTEMGFFAFKEESVPSLLDENFNSVAAEHDALVVAFQLGEWIYLQPPNVDLVTEQELKCMYSDDLPDWVPRAKNHRPDGFTRIKDGNRNRIYAIEVETVSKGPGRYVSLVDFYDERESLEGVLWLVNEPGIAQTFMRTLEKRFAKKAYLHSFFLLEDYMKMGLEAPVRFGQKRGQTLSGIYQATPFIGAGQVPGNPLHERLFMDYFSRQRTSGISLEKVPVSRPIFDPTSG